MRKWRSPRAEPSSVHQRDRRFDQPLGQFRWVADGGGGQDELRLRPVEGRHALQPADDIGDVRAEHAPVGMHLVDDHEAQVAQEIRPVGVVRQDAGVQHVGVGEDDAGVFADG